MMSFQRSRNIPVARFGFSLVEVLIYLAIFLMVTTASVAFMFSLDELVDQYRLETILYRSGTGVLEQVLLAIRQADQVNLVNTVEDDSLLGKLTVESAATSTTFELVAGALDLTINSIPYGDLTSEQVTVDGFTVYYYPLPGGQEFVRVKLDLTGTLDGAVSKSVSLYGGAIVRGAI
jgi:type II secretory pathway pseudopilin PulG